MNNKIVRRIAIALGLYLVFGIAVLMFYPDPPDKMHWEDREQFNRVQIGKLELGTSRQDIITLMGSPDISEAKKVGEESLQVMFYRTQHKQSDGITTQDECTPLLFENDRLIAWGDGTYKKYTGS